MNTALHAHPGTMSGFQRTFTALLLATLTAAAALASLAKPASAQRDVWGDFTADGRLVDVQVQVNGRTAPLFTAPGRYDRSYFQAFKGRNYSLVVRNNSSRRVGVLLAVDGLNVISGERSSLSRHEAMYVLDPYEQTTINGWRTSLHEVRRFVFVNEERSYAERTGQANGDMGWIRVLAFRENRPGWDDFGKIRDNNQHPYRGDYDDAPSIEGKGAPRAQSAPSAPDMAKQYGNRTEESNPGTGWGEREWDRVSRTHFVAEHNPVDRITLRYEYARGLAQLGIRVPSHRDRTWERERGELGFAQPPRW
jgi:hypothetical protein